VPALVERLGLDGTGRMLDVGCGPGVLARMFADRFASVVGLDPEPATLAEAARLSGPSGQWACGRAEDIPALDLGTFRLVTFGQSYHWTDRPLVADIVHDILPPGGAMAVVNHVPSARATEPGAAGARGGAGGIAVRPARAVGAARPRRPGPDGGRHPRRPVLDLVRGAERLRRAAGGVRGPSAGDAGPPPPRRPVLKVPGDTEVLLGLR
jgi:SAM-dependent methyltransferase